ncbi:hypothetical protein Y032_0086g1963 [Ancylostoma ceylanicum]|uniref:Uncharacterized protein n=1 Tax=Ancylostoma ceylanicum TaxID=53326 RepID=A0A016TPS4_9BILA|nr:hypothetical protein Y032_0086g1963 [Ancylostoma ceylanicum]
MNSEGVSSRGSEEDMEVCSDGEPSAPMCSCGAYEKIICATTLLRKRIVSAVNEELDQYEQPLGFLLRSSKQQTLAYDGLDVALVSARSQLSSQSQTCNSQLTHPQMPSVDLIVNNILCNASMLLLSRLN